MGTQAEKLAELQTELATVKAAIATARGGSSSFSFQGMSQTSWRLDDLYHERARIEKSIQRILRGGRGILTDMSYGFGGTGSDDPYRSGGEVLL
jgi:hypothetical protein